MIKTDIAKAVYDAHGGISHKEAREMVDLIFELMTSSLTRGQNVKMSGFGSLNVIHRRSRMGRNPQTGDRIRLKPSSYITFRPSKKVF